MACVVRYSFLLISICLRSTSWADAMMQVTPLIGAVGNEIIIQCAVDKTSQDGVYMYKQEGPSKLEVFYYYKDDTFTPKSPMYKAKVRVDGKIPNLIATFSNVNVTDIGLYWCEFNLEDTITVGTVTWLWIEEQGEGEKKVCPVDVPRANILIALRAVILLLCIICLVFVILKVRECWKNRPSNDPLKDYE